MKRFGIRATALALAVLIGLAPAASASVALGDDLHSGTVELAPGTELNQQVFWSNSRSDLRRENYLVYSPTDGVCPVVVYGDKLLSKQDLSAMASPGTQVCIYTDEARVKTVPVVYQDENVLVAVKPAGVSCEPDRRGGKTFPQLLCEQLGPGTAEPLLCHRLDNPTEGLLMLARTPEAQQAAQDAFRRGEVRKEYECLVRGTPSPHHAVLEAWLVKDALHARVRVLAREAEGAKRIITEYDVLERGDCARLRVRLHTGRTHQIRAHMAFIGHPLLGDDQYGDRDFNRAMKARRLMLCAVSLTLQTSGPLAYLNGCTFTAAPSF